MDSQDFFLANFQTAMRNPIVNATAPAIATIPEHTNMDKIRVVLGSFYSGKTISGSISLAFL